MACIVRIVLLTAACTGADAFMDTPKSDKLFLLGALRQSFPSSLGPDDRIAMELKFIEALGNVIPAAAVVLPCEDLARPSLDCILQRSLQSLGVDNAPRALTADELRRLPLPMFYDLQTWWVSTRRHELASLGLPLHLFDAVAVPANLRGKFVMSEGGELKFFDSKSAAEDAAETAMLRSVGPINAVYSAATGKPSPTAHVGLAADVASRSATTEETTTTAHTTALHDLLQRALQSLGADTSPRALSADELRRLPIPMFYDLQTWWVSTRRFELAALGLPLHLFDAFAVPASLRGKFVMSDGGELKFFDSKSAAEDAAETAMLRSVGPINAAYSAATDKPLPAAHVGVVTSEAVPLVTPARMALFEDLRHNYFSTTDAYEKLPFLDVIVESHVNGSIVPIESVAIYDSGSFDAFYTVSDRAHADVYRTATEMWVHPTRDVAAVSDLKCACGSNIIRTTSTVCPLWQQVPYGGRVNRNFLNWNGESVLLVGARVISSRWKVRVLVDTNSSFFAVPKDATSLVDAKLLNGATSAAAIVTATGTFQTL